MGSVAAVLGPLLIAQLLAPSLQPGPVRLPAEPPSREAPRRAPSTVPPPQSDTPAQSAPAPGEGSPALAAPRVQGWERYSSAELERILRPCLRESRLPSPAAPDAASTPTSVLIPDRLTRCAALLSSRLVADGYITSRVFPLAEPPPAGTLWVVAGRIVEVRVDSASGALRRRLRRLVLPLQGQVLHLPALERSLAQLEQLPGVGSLTANLNRLGGDSTKAVLELQAEAAPLPLVGEFSLRNDGSGGSGQFRGLGVVAKSGLLLERDQLVLAGELNSDRDPRLGYRALSLSYRLPLTERLELTAAAASSWRQLVESPPPFDALSFRQEQLLAQLEVPLQEGLRQRLAAFASLSANRNSAWLNGERFGAILGGADSGALSSGFVQAGLTWDAAFPALRLGSRLYGLQGLAGFSGDEALQELEFFGIAVGRARALAAELNASWLLAPGWQLQLRGAGQQAFHPLTNSMGFSLGSDNGLRGLPGQVISGDNGWLVAADLSWAFWQRHDQALLLVPFLGAGEVSTTLRGFTESSRLGAGGVLLRWLNGRHWELELGWARQFADNLPSADNNLLLDHGVYSKLSYRF